MTHEIAAYRVLRVGSGAFLMSTDSLQRDYRSIRRSDAEDWPVSPTLTFAALVVTVLVAAPSEATLLLRIALQILMSNR